MTTAQDTPEWFRNWWHADASLIRTASEAYMSMMSHLLTTPDSGRQELAALLNPWRPIETAPKGEEILAWNICDKTWHQVTWTGEYFATRWNEAYHQFRGDFAGWLPLPAPPSEDKP